MNKRYTILLLIFISSFSISQTISVKITGASGKVVLLKLEGENTSEVDIINLSKQDFQFSLDNEPSGIYRLEFDNRHWINFINDGEDIELKTDYYNLVDSLEIVESESNLLYYDFLKLNKLYKTKTELLNLVLIRFPQDDEYYIAYSK